MERFFLVWFPNASFQSLIRQNTHCLFPGDGFRELVSRFEGFREAIMGLPELVSNIFEP